MATTIDNDELAREAGTLAPIEQGQTMTQVRGSYVTAVAVQKPRDIERVAKALQREAVLAGESFYYGWSAGGDRIEGPSIGLLMAAARCWGNCAVEMLPVQETEASWIFTGTFVDLETGCTVARQFRQSKKSVVHGKLDEERKDDIRFQIGQSKATRNVIRNALPRWLTDQAMEAAMRGVREKIETYIAKNGMAKAVDECVKALGKVGVPKEAILERCDVAAVCGLTVDHLVVLKGDLSAIQNGQERAEALFPYLSKKTQPSDLNAAFAEKQQTEESQAPPDVPQLRASLLGKFGNMLEMATTIKECDDLLAAFVRELPDEAEADLATEAERMTAERIEAIRAAKQSKRKEQQELV